MKNNQCNSIMCNDLHKSLSVSAKAKGVKVNSDSNYSVKLFLLDFK